MFKRTLTRSDYLLILINLIPLYGVWFGDWDPHQVFVVYCMETVIIGVLNVIKMSAVTLLVRKKDVWENNGSVSMQSGWLFVFFFIVHYGLFVFIQTNLFFGVSDMHSGSGFFSVYQKIPEMLGDKGKLLLLIFAGYYCFANLFYFFKSGTYKTISLGRLLFEPYARIFIQQIVVILGGMFLAFGAGKIFMLIFVVVKLYFELFINFSRILDIAEKRQAQQNKVKK
ncbi:MAG: hypothetical protein JST86_05910 [Bacteroidetes bacterium]|nr:hypothetical protein [Bacteroidota bacterium]